MEDEDEFVDEEFPADRSQIDREGDNNEGNEELYEDFANIEFKRVSEFWDEPIHLFKGINANDIV